MKAAEDIKAILLITFGKEEAKRQKEEEVGYVHCNMNFLSPASL